jgi:hypothetical protein
MLWIDIPSAGDPHHAPGDHRQVERIFDVEVIAIPPNAGAARVATPGLDRARRSLGETSSPTRLAVRRRLALSCQ